MKKPLIHSSAVGDMLSGYPMATTGSRLPGRNKTLKVSGACGRPPRVAFSIFARLIIIKELP